MSTFAVELAQQRHLRVIPSIELQAATMFREADLPLHVRYRVTDNDVLYKAQCDSRLWVALDEAGDPVGFAMTDIVDGAAHLDEMDVLPSFSRQGIGTRLLHTAVEWARDNHFPRLTLITFKHVPWNAPFYKKRGFVSMQAAELGHELSELLKSEGKAGLDLRKRVCMQLHIGASGSLS